MLETQQAIEVQHVGAKTCMLLSDAGVCALQRLTCGVSMEYNHQMYTVRVGLYTFRSGFYPGSF